MHLQVVYKNLNTIVSRSVWMLGGYITPPPRYFFTCRFVNIPPDIYFNFILREASSVSACVYQCWHRGLQLASGTESLFRR